MSNLKVAFFDTHQFEKQKFTELSRRQGFAIEFLDLRLTAQTVGAAKGAQAVCSFVNDKVDRECLQQLKQQGVGLVALRSAGFNHVDVAAAKELGVLLSRVPGYSPHAVAEFAVGLLLTLNRKIHKASARTREQNFSLEGLVGFDLHGKTVGVIGTGKIGRIFAKLMLAFGCRVLVHDLAPDAQLLSLPDIHAVDLESLCRQSDVISLHVPLNPQTYHLINAERLALMKPKVILLNTGRGALIDAKALIVALKTQKVGGAALDVYEEEEGVFFHDLSTQVLTDDVLARLLTFPNVLVTSHQAFLTEEVLTNIADSVGQSLQEFFAQGVVGPERRI